MVRLQIRLALVVDGEPDGPGRQVSHYYRAQPPVHSADALLAPYDPRGTHEALVHTVVAHVPPLLDGLEAALGLQLRLDDVERARYDARGEAADSAGRGV